ncbi:hypothetical protein [uncultured Sneathiella sp.]|uniref:alpha/beta hydrolase family protein n=1 Tax=uncultured Sneathiella sp. TaxID=879315 RepID=UPI0030DAE0E0|tara:strand:+ start:15799 stop:16734 length:936 start_codon:yes stop_codon:yes gene_type:complete
MTIARFICTLGLLLLTSACATQENADTFSNSGVLTGSIMKKADCKWPDTSVWVVYDGKGECIRYFHGNLEPSNKIAHIWFHGDVIYQHQNGSNPQVYDFYKRDASAEAQEYKVSVKSYELGKPYIQISRPGTYGSSGDHKQRRREREVRVLNAAVDAIKGKYNISELALSGQSGGGHLVASLITMRDDVRCAVSTSGNVSVAQRNRIKGWSTDITGYNDFYDPIKYVAQIPNNPNLQIYIVADPRDTNVPFQTQVSYVDAAKAAGLNAWLIRANGWGDAHHELSHDGFRIVEWCLSGLSAEEIQKKIPIPK